MNLSSNSKLRLKFRKFHRQGCSKIRGQRSENGDHESIHFGNFSYQATPGLRLDIKVSGDSFFSPRHVAGTVDESGGDHWRRQAKRKQSEREYYETIIGSHLRHDPYRRLRSSANRHHLITDNVKPGNDLDDEAGDNVNDEYWFNHQQCGNRD